MPEWWKYMNDQSFWGSYQNAKRLRNSEAIAANDNDSGYPIDQALRAQQGQAVAGGLVTGLTGATTLLSNAYKDAQIRDTSMQEGIISDLSRAGNYNYNNYDQLANDYAQTSFSPNFNYQDIRGMTTGQQVGSVATSTLSGAATGLQIGGPWGALIGGVVGLGTGLGGVLTGNAAAHAKQDQLNLEADLAADTAQRNFAAAHERIGDNIHRQNAVNAVARGGKIQTIKDYADKVLLQKPRQAEHYNCGGRIQKVYCNGGLKIRIKK